MGFLILTLSAHKYSKLGPADMTGHDCTVQNSVMVPYSSEISLKKSTVFTASHCARHAR